MKNRLTILFVISCALFAGRATSQEIELNIQRFGAVPNDGKDDTKAFTQALNQIEKKPGNYKVFIPRGEYTIFSKIVSSKLLNQVSFVGEKGTQITVYSLGGFAVLQPVSELIELTAPVVRNAAEVSIRLPRSIKVSEGDLIHIQSNTPFETAWKYKENDIHRIKQVIKNRLVLDSKLLFNYNPSKETLKVTIYKQCKLSFKNIDFVLKPEKSPKKTVRVTTLIVVGVSLDMQDVTFNYVGDATFYHVGLSVVAGEQLNFKNIQLNNLMYGILMNYCRDVKAFNTKASRCRHAYVPAQACYNVYVEKLYGENCQSVMDAHPSFYVHYKDVKDTLAKEFPNCRSLGTIIENARIYVGFYYQTYCYWSVQSLTQEYKSLYSEYDTQFKNVYWVSKYPGNFNGLTSYTCRRLIIDSCTTHNVSYYGDKVVLQQVQIRNSQIGVVRIDGQRTTIENTQLDGRLFPKAKFVLRFSGNGETRLNKVVVKNYNPDSTYLFDYFNNLASNSLSISESEIGTLKGWTNRFSAPGKSYPAIKINSSQIGAFKEVMPRELITLPAEIKKARAGLKNK